MKKIILSIGAVCAILAPTASLIACGSEQTDPERVADSDSNPTPTIDQGVKETTEPKADKESDENILNKEIQSLSLESFSAWVKKNVNSDISTYTQSTLIDVLKTETSLNKLDEEQLGLLSEEDITFESDDENGVLIMTIVNHGEPKNLHLVGFQTRLQRENARKERDKAATVWNFDHIKSIIEGDASTAQYHFVDEVWNNVKNKLSSKAATAFEFQNVGIGLLPKDIYRDINDAIYILKGDKSRDVIKSSSLPDLLTNGTGILNGITYTTLDHQYDYGFENTHVIPKTSLLDRWGLPFDNNLLNKKEYVKDGSILIWVQNDDSSKGQIEISELADYVDDQGNVITVLKEDPQFHYLASGTWTAKPAKTS